MEELTTYSPITIANYFISNQVDTTGAGHIKLQNLIFCAHGWYLAFTSHPLSSERPQAWECGPVFPSLYLARKGQKNDAVLPDDEHNNLHQEDSIAMFLDAVRRRYKDFDAHQMTRLTHAEGAPWHKVAGEYLARDEEIPQGLVINNDMIEYHFNHMLNDAKQRTEGLNSQSRSVY